MSESTSEVGESEASLRAVLQSRTGVVDALRQGGALMARTMGSGALVLLVYAVAYTIGGVMVGDWGTLLVESPPGEDSSMASVFTGVAVFLGIYGVIQMTKGDSATRSSWWPVLFLTPSAAFAGAIAAVGSQIPPQIVPGLAMIGWDLLFESFAGAAAVFAWISLGASALDGPVRPLGEIMGDLQKRFLDVAVVHGAKAHAVLIGIQLILPGIFYMLSLAFADQIVTTDPTRKALRRSSQLTYGMRGRLFRLILLVTLVWFPVSFGAWIALDGIGDSGLLGRFTELLMAPSTPSGPAMFAQRLIFGLSVWILALAMLVLHRERERQVAAKRALIKLKDQSA